VSARKGIPDLGARRTVAYFMGVLHRREQSRHRFTRLRLERLIGSLSCGREPRAERRLDL
jgi:hypothetical protein